MPLAPGASFGRFRVVRRLGTGAMGEVYLAEDPRIERLLAIKTVRVGGGAGVSEQELRVRLLREAKAAGRLVHPHVVTLFDAGEIEDVFFLAFEYVAGSDLATRLRRPPSLTVDQIVRVARETAAGLAAAHRRDIVHRDVKPSNLLLDEEGTVKISDFGIAKLAGPGTDLSRPGALIGTPRYLSPEQVTGAPLDGRSDLFSLGVVLYELLAGRRPFAGETLTTLVYEIAHREAPPISDLRADLPPRLAAAVMRLLAKDREERFATAEALGEELAAVAAELALRGRAATLLGGPAADGGGIAGDRGVTLGEVIAVWRRRLEALFSGVALTWARRRERRAKDRARKRVVDKHLARRAVALAGTRASAESTTAGGRGLLRRLRGAGALLLVLALLSGIAAAVVAGIGGGREDGPPAAGRDSQVPAADRPTGSERESRGDRPRPPTDAENVGRAAGEGRQVPGEGSPVGGSAATAPARPRTVGGAVTFAIQPPEAARTAIVRVDGLVRGPAAGSLLTLRRGSHRVEILADGFAPLGFDVESRPGGDAPSRLELTMRRE